MSQDDAPKPPSFDDFGNPVNAIPGRTVERNAGCYNCLHFSFGEDYKTRVQQSYTRDVAVLRLGRAASPGKTAIKPMHPHEAKKKANETRQLLAQKAGFFGICKIGSPSGAEFVSSRVLCERWSGTTDAHLARSPGEVLSPLIEEVYNERGELGMIKGVVKGTPDIADEELAIPSDKPPLRGDSVS